MIAAMDRLSYLLLGLAATCLFAWLLLSRLFTFAP